MTLLDHYQAVKNAHVTFVSISVALFVARGVAVQMRSRWPMRAAVRRVSVVIDTLLISAGGLLWWMLSLNPLRERWLGAKLLLVVVYIVIGSFALKRAPTLGAKAGAFVASIVCVALVAVIALTHGSMDLAALLARLR
ncbi:MAG: SirB2 family protein [Burkholderiales bacterium]|nr:SirB2 family protein [Burkholderiales bacterium]